MYIGLSWLCAVSFKFVWLANKIYLCIYLIQQPQVNHAAAVKEYSGSAADKVCASNDIGPHMLICAF